MPAGTVAASGTGGTVGRSVSDTLQLGTVPVKLSQRAPLLLLHNKHRLLNKPKLKRTLHLKNQMKAPNNAILEIFLSIAF